MPQKQLHLILYKKVKNINVAQFIICTVLQLNRLNSTAHFYRILATLNLLSIHARFCECADAFGFQQKHKFSRIRMWYFKLNQIDD